MREMTNRYNDIRRLIRDIFWKDWDPIGLQHLDPDWDNSEYDGYADAVIQLLIDGNSEECILNALIKFADYINGTCDNNVKQTTSLVVKKLIILQPEIQKYAKLAAEEKKKYPNSEVKRQQKLNDELEEYLRITVEN
jgi:hypothetical protein